MNRARGMTVLEVMVVLAIIGGASVLVRSGFRVVTKADLVENATELAAILRRTSGLAIEHGEMHRVVFDFNTHTYVVEVCQGETAIRRNEKARADSEDEEKLRRAQERAKDSLQVLPPDPSQSTDPQDAIRRAAALSGHHIAGRMCTPATDTFSGDAQGRGWARALRVNKGIRLKEIWLQHRDESATKDEAALYFFPTGRAEKAVIELTDGSETFSILVFGLTGRVQLKDGALKDVNDHMMRNALGDKDAARDS